MTCKKYLYQMMRQAVQLPAQVAVSTDAWHQYNPPDIWICDFHISYILDMIMITFRPTFTTRQICIYGLIASILFSLIVIFQQDLLNKDGVLYVGVADLLQNWRFKDAVALYPWPFFSLLIAAFDMVTGVGLDASAYILVTIFDAAMLVAFILIVKELGGDTRVQIAAVVVVFSLAYLNENRADVIRDHGYWCFYLTSLLLYIKFYKSPGLWLGLGWSAVMLLGALFRIEGLVVWLALPLIVLLRSDTSIRMKVRYLLMSYLLHILIGSLFVAYLLVSSDDLLLTTRLGDFKLLFGQLLDGLSVDMERRMSVLEKGVLDPRYSSDFAVPSIVGILLIILGSKIITTVTLPLISLFFVPSLRAKLKNLDARTVFVLVWAGAISMSVLSAILIPRFFLSARWVLPFAFSFLLFVPFMLVRAMGNWNASKGRRRKGITAMYLLLAVLIAYGFLDGLISTSASKYYVKESGIWIKQNLDKGKKVYANDSRIHHYAGLYKKRGGYGVIRPKRWVKYDYLAIKMKLDDQTINEEINSRAGCLTNIKQFTGPRKRVVRVFRVNHNVDCETEK